MHPKTLTEWQSRGAYQGVNGLSVFAIDEGDPGLPALLFLHGYPSCSFAFYRVLPHLTPHFRVIVHDHPGFGLSDKPADYSYSLIDQADIALQLWQKLGIREGHIA